MVLSVLVLLVAGCYTLQPVAGGAAPVGSRVALDINDVGRVALGGSMGPEIAQIEGRLMGTSDEEYLIAVEVVRLLRGGEQIWNGESVRIGREHVGLLYERRFSRGRSVAMGAATLGGLVAFAVGRGIFDPGRGEPGNPPDTGEPDLRPPRP